MDLEAVRKKVEAALADRRRRVVDSESLIPAAVLLLLTNRRGPHVVFAKRTEDVTHHKGQFSFPGGICEERDASRVETALREAWEEIRLPADAVEVLGLLDDTATRATPFVITPVVGIVRGPVEFRPDGREIERVIEVSLDRLRDPAIFSTEMWERDGEVHPVHFYQVSAADVVWGATARILKQFLDILDDAEVIP